MPKGQGKVCSYQSVKLIILIACVVPQISTFTKFAALILHTGRRVPRHIRRPHHAGKLRSQFREIVFWLFDLRGLELSG